MRKTAKAIAALVLAAGLLVGCGASASESKSESVSESTSETAGSTAESTPVDFTCLNGGADVNYKSEWKTGADTLTFTVDMTDPTALKGAEVYAKDGCTITITDVTDVGDVSCKLHMQATGVCADGQGTLYTLYLPAELTGGPEQQATLQTEPEAFRSYFAQTESTMTAAGNEFVMGVFHSQDTPDTTATVTAEVFQLMFAVIE